MNNVEQEPVPESEAGPFAPVKRKNRKVAMMFGAICIGMFGFAFALVPLYKLVCQVTGINSISTQGERTSSNDFADSVADKNRTIKVEFDATINGQLPWEFTPSVRKMQVHPGDIMQMNFVVRNNSDQQVTTQAIPGITPWQATEYFNKVECFCFNTQTLEPGEEKEMGLKFVISPALPKEISTLTLSYTIMNTNREQAKHSGNLQVLDTTQTRHQQKNNSERRHTI